MDSYIKKRVLVQAVQWKGDNFDEVAQLGDTIFGPYGFGVPNEEWLEIETLEGRMQCSFGDWVIRGIKGECYPCRNDIFQLTYEKVEV